jgi:hypothetical protein
VTKDNASKSVTPVPWKVSTTPVPHIERIAVRVGALERRLDFLERRLREEPERAAGPSGDYDRAEVEALKAGVACLRYVQEITSR